MVPSPHLGCLFWVLNVGTQRHLTGTVANIDRGPVAGGQQQVYVVSGRLSSHQVLGAAHHLETGVGERRTSNTRPYRSHRGHFSSSFLYTYPTYALFRHYLVGADLGQLASGEVWGGWRGRGEASVNKCVQGDQGRQ